RSLRVSGPFPIGADEARPCPFARRLQSPAGLAPCEEGIEVLPQNEIDDFLPAFNGTDAIGQFPRVRHAGRGKRGLLTFDRPLTASEDLCERVAPMFGRSQLFARLLSIRLGLDQRSRGRSEIPLPLLEGDTCLAGVLVLLASLPLCPLEIPKALLAFARYFFSRFGQTLQRRHDPRELNIELMELLSDANSFSGRRDGPSRCGVELAFQSRQRRRRRGGSAVRLLPRLRARASLGHRPFDPLVLFRKLASQPLLLG